MRIRVINKPKKPWEHLTLTGKRYKNENKNNKKWEVIKSSRSGTRKQHIYSYHTLDEANRLAKKRDEYSVRGKLSYKGKGLTSKEEKVFIALCHYIAKLHKEAA